MKGIERCGECGYYNWNRHRCTNGANKDTDPRASFFADCPLKDVQPVVHGKWVNTEPEHNNECHHSAYYQCSECGRRTGIRQTRTYKYCPHCGARMDRKDGNG